MEENNNANEQNKNSGLSEKEAKKEKKADKNKKEGIQPSFFQKHKAEFRKIKWPTKQELIKETITVIVVSLLVGAIIFGFDTIIKLGFDALIDVVKL